MARTTDSPESPRLRLDKWLWAARFYRTRSLALEAIEAGRVSVNGVRPKPSRAIGPGDVVTVQRPPYAWEVEVLGLSERRGPAREAALLYRETPESEMKRREMAERQALMKAASPIAHERPNKRQRREILRFIERLEARIDAAEGSFE
jgi:ribosome-associated heat shock protein Hsp15